MRLTILFHRDAQLDEWEEEIRKALEGKVEPLELEILYTPYLTDLPFLKAEGDVVVAVLAPKKELMPIAAMVAEKLLDKGIRVFVASFDEMPSLLEDFLSYLADLLGITL